MQKKTQTPTRPTSLEPIYQVWGWILLFWSLYRYFFHLPEVVDEFVFKPLIFLTPVLWFVRRFEKRSLESIGITGKNLYKSLYIGLFFGFIFAFEGMLLNIFRNGQLSINPIDALQQYGLVYLMIISLATGVSEEVLNRGFLFTRIHEKTKNLPVSVVISTVLFLLLHVPILVTSLKLHGLTLILFFISNAMMGVLNSLLMYQLGSVVAPILVHIFWNMTVAMYF